MIHDCMSGVYFRWHVFFMHVRNINAFCERIIASNERLIKEGSLGSAQLVNNGVLLPRLSRSLFLSI